MKAVHGIIDTEYYFADKARARIPWSDAFMDALREKRGTMQALQSSVLAIILAWNLTVMAIYASDKQRARKKRQRIPERTLLAFAFLCGGAGALAGMLLFRHKTKHIKFILLVPLACLVTFALAWLAANMG